MLRPKMTPFKTFQEAAVAIDDMIVAQPLEGKSDGFSPSYLVSDQSACTSGDAEEEEEEEDNESVDNNGRKYTGKDEEDEEEEEEDADEAANDDEASPAQKTLSLKLITTTIDRVLRTRESMSPTKKTRKSV